MADTDIAAIYEMMLKGDSSALSTLQQVKRKLPFELPPKPLSSRVEEAMAEPPYFLPEDRKQSAVSKPSELVEDNQHFRKYLKQKMMKLRQVKQSEIPKEINKEIRKEITEIPKEAGKPDSRKTTSSKRVQKDIIEKDIIEKGIVKKDIMKKDIIEKSLVKKNIIEKELVLPQIRQASKAESHKSSKVTSAQDLLGKRTPQLAGSRSQAEQLRHKSVNLAKGSKNQQLREQFRLLNEQERTLQMQILQQHNSMKSELDTILKRYSLAPYKSKNPAISVQPTPAEWSSEAFLKEKETIDRSTAEIKHINTLFEERASALRRTEKQLQASPFLAFLAQPIEAISEENEEEEADTIHPLVMHSTEKYSSAMPALRSKKWNLKQRVEYDINRVTVMSESRSQHGLSRVTHQDTRVGSQMGSQMVGQMGVNHQEASNRVTVVNERLRSLLMD